MSARALWALFGLGLCACGGSAAQQVNNTRSGGVDPALWPADDRSLCYGASQEQTSGLDYSAAGFVAETTASELSVKPNVRRIFYVVGESGGWQHRTLVCREADTNLDGIKDVARFFDAKGQPVSEQADRNFDGKIDVWLVFLDGKIAEIAEDTTRSLGRPNEWRLYNDGQLTRVRRDRNGDGKPDQWESYADGKLERVGVDEDGDGKVDRWDRDEVLRLEQEHALGRAQVVPPPAVNGGAGEENEAEKPESGEDNTLK